MFEVRQEHYREIALKCLAEHGITAAALAQEASPGLKRFRLDVDMGLLDVEVPEGAPGEDPLLPYATSLLAHLIAWPPKVADYGVSIAGLIEDAICWVVGFNDAEVDKPDWKTRVGVGWEVGAETDDRKKQEIVSSRFAAGRYMEQLLHDLPVEHYSYRICEVALTMSLDCLQHIPVEARTPEVCVMAVKVLASNAVFIPQEIMTDNLLMKVIEISPFSITAIPEKFYTRDLINLAITGNPESVVFIPDEHLTPKQKDVKFKIKEEAVQRVRDRKQKNI